MGYADQVRKTHQRARDDQNRARDVAFEAACLTNIMTATEADVEVARLREALVQARGALLLDTMTQDDGSPYGTTWVALQEIEKALYPREEQHCAQCGDFGSVPVDDDKEGDWDWKDCPDCVGPEAS